MKRPRLSATERKALILRCARRIFSRHGYEAARTQEIAREAGVSEALMYRHFPSKRVLYQAVLRQTIREQNDSFDTLGLMELSGQGIVASIRGYFMLVASDGNEHFKEGFRLLLASLTGDGSFAALVYRRSRRIMSERIRLSLEQARRDGDIVGSPIDERNTSMFIEHVGTMLNAIQALGSQTGIYIGDRDQIVRDAVWFCCRGIGFTDAALERHYGD
jgi:AcrR family transcriptional regulator